MTQALAEYRQHIDALNAEANRHLAEIKRIEEEKRQLSMTTEERIRDIRRQGMTEFEATEDRKRQVAEYQEKARTALANGEFEQARQLAQKAMDLASQVASAQTSEAKRGEDARKASEQAVTQVTQLEAQSREAYRKQEYAQAEALMRQADQLRAELAQRTKEADAQIAQGKDGVNQAIQRIRESEEILNQTLDAEAKAHQRAAQAALSAREEIQRTLTETSNQIDQITAKLAEGLKVTLDADTSRFDQAIADLDKAIAEKQYLLAIQADLQEAEKKLKEYEQLLKEGKTLPVDADVSKAKEALDKLKVYADQNSQFELKVATEKAQAAIGNVERQILALDRIQTESQHQVNSNADAARAEIQSLNGMNTSSTHTIYVRKVETNATGGLVGRGVRQFARGGLAAASTPSGAVSPAFPRMSGGSVPGSGHHDTVPRTLEAGSFVIRKAAVQKYGSGALARLASGVARFAVGGPVRVFGGGRSPAGGEQPSTPKKNREAAEALKMIELGLQAMNEYTGWLQWNYGASVSLDMQRKTMEYWGTMARDDRRALDGFIGRKTLTGNERQTLERIKQNWRQAMAQPLRLRQGRRARPDRLHGAEPGRVLPARRHGEVRQRAGHAHAGRVRGEQGRGGALRLGLLRGGQQPVRAGQGACAACPGFCHGRPRSARRARHRPARYCLPTAHRPGPSALNWLRATARSQPPSMRATSRACCNCWKSPGPGRSESHPHATEEPRDRGGSAIARRLAVDRRARLDASRGLDVLPRDRRAAGAVRRAPSRPADHAGRRYRHGLGDPGHGCRALRVGGCPAGREQRPLRTDASPTAVCSRWPFGTARRPSRPSPSLGFPARSDDDFYRLTLRLLEL